MMPDAALEQVRSQIMTRTTQSILVAVVTIIAVLAVQTVWHHFNPPNTPRAGKKVQKPLPSQQAAEAQQAARDFFSAFKDGNWDTVAKFWPPDAPKGKQFNDIFTEKVKGIVSGLEIVSIGTPYKEAGNGWVMIPYEVDFKGGDSQTNSLRMMKGPSGQWIWGGGF
jgi:hypothetical protein